MAPPTAVEVAPERLRFVCGRTSSPSATVMLAMGHSLLAPKPSTGTVSSFTKAFEVILMAPVSSTNWPSTPSTAAAAGKNVTGKVTVWPAGTVTGKVPRAASVTANWPLASSSISMSEMTRSTSPHDSMSRPISELAATGFAPKAMRLGLAAMHGPSTLAKSSSCEPVSVGSVVKNTILPVAASGPVEV